MLTLPPEYCTLILAFAPIFSPCMWPHVLVLLVGAILAPGHRTVTAVVRIMGLSHDPHVQNYQRVLNRAKWSSLKASRVVLLLLVQAFAARGPLVFGLDDTSVCVGINTHPHRIERRRGEKITATGLYRDPVRSSHSQVVKTSSVRWLSLMLLVPIPWALPFLTGASHTVRAVGAGRLAPTRLGSEATRN